MEKVILLRDSIHSHLLSTRTWATELMANLPSGCKRKSVGCALLRVDWSNPYSLAQTHNGPSGSGHVCTDEVGNCGCSHAEPRAVISALKTIGKYRYKGIKLVCLCQYSPCTNCANILLDSKLICGCVYETLTEHDTRGAVILAQVVPVFSLEQLMSGSEKALAALSEWSSFSSDR